MVYTTLLTNHVVPATAAGTGKRRPAMNSVVRKGARFSVKFACARWAQLSLYACGLAAACSAVAKVFG